jgi:hypothetical protein
MGPQGRKVWLNGSMGCSNIGVWVRYGGGVGWLRLVTILLVIIIVMKEWERDGKRKKGGEGVC